VRVEGRMGLLRRGGQTCLPGSRVIVALPTLRARSPNAPGPRKTLPGGSNRTRLSRTFVPQGGTMSVQTSPEAPVQPGVPVIVGGELISTSPATGVEVGRFPVADAAAVGAALDRARSAATWWRGLGFEGRRERLLRWKVSMAKRMNEMLDIMHDEGGKPRT